MPFTIRHNVLFSETDMAGIAHFANYFRWMEEVEHAFFRSAGLSVHMRHGGRDISWPRVSANCDYAGPARFEDEVELRLTIVKLSEKSLTHEVEFLNQGRRIATGRITCVCCELTADGMRAITIPADIREKLRAAESSVPES